MRGMENLVHSLESLYDEITGIALLTHSLEKEAKALRNPYTEVYKLRAPARKFFKMEEASLKDMTAFLIPMWKADHRLSSNGRHVKLGKEAKLLGFEEGETVDVYEVYDRLKKLQKS